MRRNFLMLLVLIALAATYAWQHISAKHIKLTEAPPRGATETDFAPAESTLGLAVAAPLSRLRDEIRILKLEREILKKTLPLFMERMK